MIFGSKGLNSPLPPQSPLPGAPLLGLRYPKMKIEIIFEIPTIENPKIDIHKIFGGIPPLAGRQARRFNFYKVGENPIFYLF